MDLKAFRPTKEKASPASSSQIACSSTQQQLDTLRLAQVKVVEFHAVQPWLAMADVSGAVALWNWESQQASRRSCLPSCQTHYADLSAYSVCCCPACDGHAHAMLVNAEYCSSSPSHSRPHSMTTHRQTLLRLLMSA